MRFKRPKNGHYTKYCFGCRHYEFERQVGCAYLGKCTAIEDEPTEQDAYDPPCGLWEKRTDTPQTDTHDLRTDTHECVKDTHDKTSPNSSEKPNNSKERSE